MAFDVIEVCVFGLKNKDKIKEITLLNSAQYEAESFEFHLFDSDNSFEEILYQHRPQIILTFGKASNFSKIWNSPIEIRQRWINIEDENVSGHSIAEQIMLCYVELVVNKKRFSNIPLISVFTPTYKTGSKILRPFHSLLEQTYTNWEWVIYDDSPDNDKTFNEMVELAKKDHRISVYKSNQPCGIIGEVKRRACMLAKGSILVELDHDDELTVTGLQHVVQAFEKYPDAGFAYTDCAETWDNGQMATYSEGWGFGYGSYRIEEYKGRQYAVTNFPSVNSKTIRHIVAAPNHIRAWKKDAYIEIGGHNSEVHVCDDYELIVRTFLKTRMIHIQKFGYIQYYNVTSTSQEQASGNTQRKRNKEIQRLVKYFRWKYNKAIHERFVELGVDDFCYQNGVVNFDIPNPIDTPYANYVYK